MPRAPHSPLERGKLLLNSARRLVYRTTDSGEELALHIYLPKDGAEGPPRPCLLFFHGGAGERASPAELAPHALHYVERGAVCALAEYRHPGARAPWNPDEAREDACAAVIHLRTRSDELHFDPGRLAVVGAGAGANLAASLGFARRKRREQPSSRPDAAIVLSAFFDLVPNPTPPENLSACASASIHPADPSRQVARGAAPMLVVHGTADRVVPFARAEAFVSKTLRKWNRCRLVEFEGRDREFYHLHLDPASFEALLAEIDAFLDELGLLARKEGEASPHVFAPRELDA